MIYEIADLRIDIKNRCAYTTKFCAEYLSEDQTSAADFAVEVTNEQFLAEKAISPGFSDGYVENICLYRNICLEAPKYDRILLHACILNYKDKGYAFLGKSGTGKSTHSGLWLKYLDGAYIVNGDKPILSFQKDGIYAYGTPWMGKERLGQKGKVKLSALCFLRQAKVNKIEKLPLSQAVQRLFGQVLVPSEEGTAARTLELADELVNKIPSYLLDCDISQEAVKVAFEEMVGEQFSLKEKNYED